MTMQSSPESTSQSKRPVALLDANVWIKEWMLNSAAGANLVDFLAQSNGKILLPEIGEKELKLGISKQAQSAIAKITVEMDHLHKLTQEAIPFNSPSSAVIDEGIDTNLQGLARLLIRCDFTLKHAKKDLKTR
jgi:hypothetical protein